MPLYEYQCEACGERFEVIQKFSDPAVDVCRHCGRGPVQKLLSSPAIQFKGSGWYITDYARKSGEAGTSSSDSSSASKTDGSSTDASKPAASKESSSTGSDAAAAKPAGSASKDS